jgi:ankyrin repeat protein
MKTVTHLKNLLMAVLVPILLVSFPLTGLADTSELEGKINDAAANGDITELTSILDKNPKIVDIPGKYGKTPLMRAAEAGKLDAVALLLSYGAEVNARTRSGSTALTFAAENGFAGITAMLVEMGANVHDRTRSGWDALMIAAKSGYDNIVAQLLHFGADIRASDKKGNNALMYAVTGGHTNVVKAIFHYTDSAAPCLPNAVGMTPLMLALDKGNLEIAKLLIPHMENVNKIDDTGSTALHYASEAGDDEIEIITMLLEKHAKLNIQDEDGATALMLAAAGGHVKTVKLLLEHGADASLKNNDGETAQQIAKKKDNAALLDVFKTTAKE